MTEGKDGQGLNLGNYLTEFGKDVLFGLTTLFHFFEKGQKIKIHFNVIRLEIIWSGTYLWVQMTARGAQLPPQGVIHPLVLLAH